MISPAPAFRLISTDGRWVGLADLRGKVVVVTFLYATCADTCPLLTAKLVGIQRGLDEAEFELRRANEILPEGLGVFCAGGARPPSEVMVAFIDAHRGAYGGEPICAILPIAASVYYKHQARRRMPRASRHGFDATPKLRGHIARVWRGVREVLGSGRSGSSSSERASLSPAGRV